MISVIIPTRGRPRDLSNSIKSIILQSLKPNELIIIDQSTDNSSREIVESMMSQEKFISLIYVLDQKINGLVEAKNVGVSHAKGNIVCFLEDDVVLETSFIEELYNGFNINTEMLGSCGVVTNPPQQTIFYRYMFHIFHRGIFRDKRVGIYGNNNREGRNLIESDCISGGLSAWRREVFSKVPFDLQNGFHMYEDIDFSTRVASMLGRKLFINPNARLAHYCSPINRDFLGARQRRKLIECITYYKKRSKWNGAKISFIWLLIGLFIEAIYQSFSARSILVLNGFFIGLFEGFKKKIIETLL
jgi:GT2 family glycosyltransferase